jgi:Na+/glutamate symporter
MSARDDELSLRLSFLWIPASVIGGAVFYICLVYGALSSGTSLNSYVTASPSEWIFFGSLGYALLTVPCVALLVAVAGRKSAPKPALVTP